MPPIALLSRHTDDLLVSTIFARTDVDKIEQDLASGETTHKVFEVADLLNCSSAHKHFSKAADIGIDATDDA